MQAGGVCSAVGGVCTNIACAAVCDMGVVRGRCAWAVCVGGVRGRRAWAACVVARGRRGCTSRWASSLAASAWKTPRSASNSEYDPSSTTSPRRSTAICAAAATRPQSGKNLQALGLTG
eukprot:7382710-Prymnesium_polylepis.1